MIFVQNVSCPASTFDSVESHRNSHRFLSLQDVGLPWFLGRATLFVLGHRGLPPNCDPPKSKSHDGHGFIIISLMKIAIFADQSSILRHSPRTLRNGTLVRRSAGDLGFDLSLWWNEVVSKVMAWGLRGLSDTMVNQHSNGKTIFLVLGKSTNNDHFQ